MRIKKCKVCKEPFESKNINHIVCSYNPCGILYQNQLREKKAKSDWQKEKKVLKEKIKTHSDWLADLQKLVNSYIRHRDIHKGCISCGTSLIGKKFDAGHYFTIGSSPGIRFDEDNIHGQCTQCNQHNHGQIAEYSIRLPERIGTLRFEALKQKRNESRKMTIPEIKEQIEFYKQKIKLISWYL